MAQSGTPRIDTAVAHPARRYNYWLGGKDHFAADRKSGDEIAAAFPTVKVAAIENRRFMQRAVGFLAGQGFRQFLDIGTGIPMQPNVHDIAREARVVYVDNDPLVGTHARALLAGEKVAFLDGDLRDPEAIIKELETTSTLDMHQPVALLLGAIVHFLTDYDRPRTLVRKLMDALPRGSALVLTHGTVDPLPADQAARITAMGNTGPHGTFQPRSRSAVETFFASMTLVDPGLVSIQDWRPVNQDVPSADQVCVYGGVALKR
jgi:S-adenosyl methyltransferase